MFSQLKLMGMSVVCAAALSTALAAESSSTVCFTVNHPGVAGGSSYLDLVIQPAGAPVFDAWCVDLDKTITPGTLYTARVYALGDPAVAGLFDRPDAPDNLDLVLYILNKHYPGKTSPNGYGTYTFGDVQRAIWQLLEDTQSTGGLGPWSQLRVNEILADAAANGEGYAPGCGDTTVLFVKPVLQGCAPNTTSTTTAAQILIIEVLFECASIGDFVWHDMNQNGIQDLGEPGIPDVTVQLFDCAGNLVATTTTDANGYYLFSDLVPGDYFVQVTAPAGYAFSPQDQGGDDALDSDADVTSGAMACTTLEGGENDLTWDAGLYKLPTNPGTGTPGYWKNHPEAWPVEVITIGGIAYTKEQAIAMMGLPDGDKRNTLFRALVCATLNVMIGNDSSCIADTIAAGNDWWAAFYAKPVKASSTAWKAGEPIYLMLDAYNNGLLCAPHRD
jgi:hypothetical protein